MEELGRTSRCAQARGASEQTSAGANPRWQLVVPLVGLVDASVRSAVFVLEVLFLML